MKKILAMLMTLTMTVSLLSGCAGVPVAMNDSVKELDRHKQAAILLYCTIKNRLFIPAVKPKKNEVFVGCEQIGLLLSLSYMKDMLNEVLKEINEKPIERYILPQAFSCSTEYFDILTRDLYLQEHEDDGVYVLFLAHVLFLIEYNTLKEIDANIIRKLKDYTKSEQC
jgi:hypothetical protein